MQVARSTTAATTRAAASGRAVCRASNKPTGYSVSLKQVASGVLAAGVALSLNLAGGVLVQPAPALAAPIRLADKQAEREAELEEQLARMQYALQQQQTVARAEIVGKRQQLENTVEQVDTAIQRKLIEEAANEQAAAKKGDEQRAERIALEAAAIKEQQKQVQVAVAKAEAQLDRAELVEKAREVGKQQEVAKASSSVMDLLGLKPSDIGL